MRLSVALVVLWFVIAAAVAVGHPKHPPAYHCALVQQICEGRK